MNIVIVGAGLAGAKAVEELREQGYDGDVTLVGAEHHTPYERPPLSKGLLLGTEEPDAPFVHEPSWYADHGVELLTGDPVDGARPRRRAVAGGRPARSATTGCCSPPAPSRGAWPWPTTRGAASAYLRTLEDSLALKERLCRRRCW